MNKMREVCELIGIPFEKHFTVRFRKPCGIVFDLYADYDGLYLVLPTGDLGVAGGVIWAKLAKGEYQIESVDAEAEAGFIKVGESMNKNKYYRDMSPDEDKECEEVRELKAWRRRHCEEHPWKQSDFVQEAEHE